MPFFEAELTSLRDLLVLVGQLDLDIGEKQRSKGVDEQMNV